MIGTTVDVAQKEPSAFKGTIAIVGLGLIGGSLAQAYQKQGFRILGSDIDPSIIQFATLAGAVHAPLTKQNIALCDYVFLAINPAPALNWIKENAPYIGADTIVIDCCGTKKAICQGGFAAAKAHGFTFIGGHPMAGKQEGGFKNSSENLFCGATFILVPLDHNQLDLLTRVKNFLTLAGFGEIAVTTADNHDQTIAYTSQMTHLIANAFVKSNTATIGTKAAFGGSFKDFTRVANLDENLWTALFIENKSYLLSELSTFIQSLCAYQTALEQEDAQTLKALLIQGKNFKKEADKNGAS